VGTSSSCGSAASVVVGGVTFAADVAFSHPDGAAVSQLDSSGGDARVSRVFAPALVVADARVPLGGPAKPPPSW